MLKEYHRCNKCNKSISNDGTSRGEEFSYKCIYCKEYMCGWHGYTVNDKNHFCEYCRDAKKLLNRISA